MTFNIVYTLRSMLTIIISIIISNLIFLLYSFCVFEFKRVVSDLVNLLILSSKSP